MAVQPKLNEYNKIGVYPWCFFFLENTQKHRLPFTSGNCSSFVESGSTEKKDSKRIHKVSIQWWDKEKCCELVYTHTGRPRAGNVGLNEDTDVRGCSRSERKKKRVKEKKKKKSRRTCQPQQTINRHFDQRVRTGVWRGRVRGVPQPYLPPRPTAQHKQTTGRLASSGWCQQTFSFSPLSLHHRTVDWEVKGHGGGHRVGDLYRAQVRCLTEN